MSERPEELSRIDVAKGVINDRVMALHGGAHAGYANTAPLFVGMPITHDEATWLTSISAVESAEQIAKGIPVVDVLRGAFEWTLLVGIAAGMAGE
jgi:hypothetical protein